MKKKVKPIVISKDIIIQSTKPRFNPFAAKAGAHKNKKKYDRKQNKKIEKNCYSNQ